MYELNVPADKPPAEEKPEAPLLSLFSSFGSKLSATAQAYAPVIKTTVSSTLEKAEALVQREKEAFVLEQKKTTVPTPQALEAEESVEVLPWSNLPPAQAEQLKRQVMMLSHEKWNFMSPLNRDEPHGFEPYMVGQAKALLAVDPELNKMRFLLVPTKVKEEPFWANYFSRVRFLKTTLSQPQAPQTQTPAVAPQPASAATPPSSLSATASPAAPHAPLAAGTPAAAPAAASGASNAKSAGAAAATPPASVSVSVSGLNSMRAANAVPPARPKAPAAALSVSPAAPSHMQPATAAVPIVAPASAAASVPSPPNSPFSISSDPTHVPLPGLSPAAQAAATATATATASSPVSIVGAGQSPHSASMTPASLATRAPPPTPQSPASPLGGSATDDLLLTFEADAALAGDVEGEVALVDVDELEQSIDAILGLGAPKGPKT